MTLTPVAHDDGPPAPADLSAQVAAEVRAWMGRRNIRQSQLARRLGENDQWLSMRLRGVTPIDLNELQRIAEALGVEPAELLPGGPHFDAQLPIDPLAARLVATIGEPDGQPHSTGQRRPIRLTGRASPHPPAHTRSVQRPMTALVR